MTQVRRLHEYQHEAFGLKVKEYRSNLNLPYTTLSDLTDINTGTLKHVEKGDKWSSLPKQKRRILVDVLIETAKKANLPYNEHDYSKFLELAGLVVDQKDISEQVMAENKLDEEKAEVLSEQNKWKQAIHFWQLAAWQAAICGDWPKWARCILSAGVMALNLGQLEDAESWFNLVLGHPLNEVGIEAHAEADIRLGWIFYYQGKYGAAISTLQKGLGLLQGSTGGRQFRPIRIVEHSSMLVWEGNEAMEALTEMGWHFLGRAYCDLGIKRNKDEYIRKGLTYLKQSYTFNRKLGRHANMGFDLLRQVPTCIREDETETAKNHIAQSKELLGDRAMMTGHIYLHKALLVVEEQPEKARNILERAVEGYMKPVFYPRGLSNVLREIGASYLMDGKKGADSLALEYELAATVLFPYGENIEHLQMVARTTYLQMDKNNREFYKCWRELEDKVRRMDSQPFLALRQ